MAERTAEFSQILAAQRGGDRGAADRLFAMVYDELHALAHRQIRRSRPGETLRTTALVHEVYLKLAQGAIEPNDRKHFYAIAAGAMRQILVDYARSRTAKKRGGDFAIFSLEGDEPADEGTVAVIALDDALADLARVDERLGRMVELRFFAGLSVEETATAMDLSTATVKRDWRAARAYLYDALHHGGGG
jgi:RNA polymerase sigma factor (TIGR02999 family)